MEQNDYRSRRILVVDDEAVTRESIRLLLSIDRHTVLEVADANEALEVLARESVDLVILDYFMPGLSGNQLAEAIKSRTPELPILMISAYLEKLGTGERTSVDAVLGKPFGMDELRLLVAQLLAKRGRPRDSL